MTGDEVKKGFCPFCGSEFYGEYDNCPFCNQDIRQYTDDLGPVLKKVQDKTNIDMKSTKVRVAMAVIIFLLVFAGALVVMDYIDEEPAIVVPDEPAPVVVPTGPVTEGLYVEIRTNGYMDLTGDFTEGDLNVTPLYEPDFMLRLSLGNDLASRYYKISWEISTGSYNKTNIKDPFNLRVTQERSTSSSFGAVTWTNLTVGAFKVVAYCFSDDGDNVLYEGNGKYYGRLNTNYSWVYDGKEMSFDYVLPTDDVASCLNIDSVERLDKQNRSTMKDYVTDNMSITEMASKLKALYGKYYAYSDAGFADFVLSFVQTCFPTELDSYNYHVSDYWATPLETILWGCGDDEDKAILYCALMKAAELDVGLVYYPETTMAAVNVPMDDAKTVRGLYNSYVIADVDSDLGLGKIRDSYDVSDDGRTLYYNGELLHGRYRLDAI